MPNIGEFLFGQKDKIKQAKTLTPDQEQLLSLIKEGLISNEGPLKELFGSFNRDSFEEGVAKPELKRFQEEILPMLQEKYIAGGQSMGSGMRRAELKAGTDLSSRLAELLYQAQQQQKQNQMTGVNTSLGTKAFENVYKQGSEGLVPGIAKGAAQGLGQAAMMAIAG